MTAFAISRPDISRVADERIARALAMPAPRGFSPTWWLDIASGADRFASRWAARATELGWREIELWGVDPEYPASIHPRGLGLMLAQANVVAMTTESAVIRSFRGGRTHYRRWRANYSASLIWEITTTDADARERTSND